MVIIATMDIIMIMFDYGFRVYCVDYTFFGCSFFFISGSYHRNEMLFVAILQHVTFYDLFAIFVLIEFLVVCRIFCSHYFAEAKISNLEHCIYTLIQFMFFSIGYEKYLNSLFDKIHLKHENAIFAMIFAI